MFLGSNSVGSGNHSRCHLFFDDLAHHQCGTVGLLYLISNTEAPSPGISTTGEPTTATRGSNRKKRRGNGESVILNDNAHRTENERKKERSLSTKHPYCAIVLLDYCGPASFIIGVERVESCDRPPSQLVQNLRYLSYVTKISQTFNHIRAFHMYICVLAKHVA